MGIKNQLAILLVCISIAPISQSSSSRLPKHLAGLDEHVESAMNTMQLPGLALAIVDETGIVLAKGYGVRKKGEPDKIDHETLFEIGSITKAFTATAIGILVEEGEVSWQTPIRKFIPYFELDDPYISKAFTVADALSHRGGYNDSYYYDVAELDRRELIRLLRYEKPAMPFRSGFAYHNALFSITGELIPILKGVSWASYIQQRILNPLGMDSTRVTTNGIGNHKNIAAPHVLTTKGMESFPRKTDEIDVMPEAGAILSNAGDMARWCQFQIMNKTSDNDTLINSATQAQMHTQHAIGTFSWFSKWGYGNTRAGYGLGWMMFDYRNDEDQLIAHGGSVDGVQSWMVYSPKNKYCIAMMSNGDWSGDPAHFAIANWIQDRYLRLDKKDWIKDLLQFERDEMVQGVNKQASNKGKNTLIALSQPISKYIGDYAHPSYGNLSVEQQGEDLKIRLGKYQTIAEHWRGETLFLNWGQPGDTNAYITFDVSPRGKITGLSLDWWSVDKVQFTKLQHGSTSTE